MSRHEKRQRLKELRKVMKAVERRGAGHRPAMAALAALVALLDSAMAETPVPGRSTTGSCRAGITNWPTPCWWP